MLTTHRKRLILDRLRAEGQVIAKSISHELGLSEDTIRRDLRELAQEGLLQRVHGGALPASPAVADFAGRQLFGAAGKNAIGRSAKLRFFRQLAKLLAKLEKKRTKGTESESSD